MKATDALEDATRTYRKSLRLVAVFSLLSSLCMLALPMFMFNTYRNVIPSKNIETLIALFLLALVLLVTMGILDAARQIMMSKAASRFEMKLAGIVMAGELNRQHDPRSQTVGDLLLMRQYLSGGALTALFDLPMLPLFLIVLYLIHPVLGTVVLVGGLGLIGLALWADRETEPYLQKNNQNMVRSQKSLGMHFAMQEYVRSQGLYRQSLADWGQYQKELIASGMDHAAKTAAHTGIAKSSRQILQVLLIGSGALLVLAGDADMVVVFAAAIIGGRALQPVDQLVGGWKGLRQTYDAYKRLSARMAELSLPQAATPLPAPDGKVLLERVTYVPQPGKPPILRNISLSADPGDIIGVIGPSGAGKSTLSRILVGYLEPSIGFVRLDGQELKVWDPVARGFHIGYVPQRVDFFEATVRENISGLRNEDPPEWAVSAAQRAGVHDLILTMPEGYDTPLSKSGYWPSGGQSQLIALARAFYGDPRLLVLDEPNASLDQVGEQIFHNALKTAKASGITSFVATHRPAALQYCNKVLVLQDGRQTDFGPTQSVLGGKAVKTQAVGKAQPEAQAEARSEARTEAQAQAQPQVRTQARPNVQKGAGASGKAPARTPAAAGTRKAAAVSAKANGAGDNTGDNDGSDKSGQPSKTVGTDAPKPASGKAADPSAPKQKRVRQRFNVQDVMAAAKAQSSNKTPEGAD
ncbi:type I secretion system permease/ATPase [Eilatimonas milleporae]|uniref:ATP-binding cassette subfamily C protein/ATP-binding cassette subfamily C exporter for protease/lipase n=1 Tax=Eilatimonas milleporae TaxID=911205 RepID=A0A3M0CSE7_9PROT|nr:ATP-binding cassette domain-containing protein [Eilatimonas milleporae]RMB12448.1 ATP-binding cassette subfamily C protein/ATP-binding cassette subfamily C exporter for protease/lipase [Eilatimonas milleporae]